MGILRFLLALSVIASHSYMIGIPFPNEKPYTSWYMSLIDGRQAVALFFIISGFYMAMVLNTKYQNLTLRFYFNRFLRLWPTYIVVFVLTCFFTPAATNISEIIKECGIGVKAYVWLSNIFILGTDSFWLVSLKNCHLYYHPTFVNSDANGQFLLLNNPAFSISIEMIFYLIAPFILKSIKKTWLFFTLGVLFHFYSVLSGNNNIIYQYHLFPSSFLYFGMGALAWHYSQGHKHLLNSKNSLLILAVCFILMFVNSLLPMIILLGFTILTPKLFELTKNNSADRLIGELSYPLYIIHWPVLIYLGGTEIENKYKGFICLGVTLCLSLIIHFLLERPIEKWRLKIANK